MGEEKHIPRACVSKCRLFPLEPRLLFLYYYSYSQYIYIHKYVFVFGTLIMCMSLFEIIWQRIMESISISGEVGGAGGAYSYSALKRLDTLWSTICSAKTGFNLLNYLAFLKKH